MAAIANFFYEQTTAQNRTGATAYVDVSGAQIPSTDFVAGDVYLLVVQAQVRHNNTGGEGRARVIHGSTPFAESELAFEPSGASGRCSYFWFDVWEAVSGESITLQHATDVTASTTTTDQATLWAVRLTGNFTQGVDYLFNQRSNDDAATTAPTYTAGGSVTWTPAHDGDVWLLMFCAQTTPGSTSTSVQSRGNIDGTAFQEWICEGEDITAPDLLVFGGLRAAVLSNSEHTFKEEFCANSGTAHTRLHSKVLALNLSKFKDVSQVYTSGLFTATSTSGYGDNFQTLSHTKTIDGDVIVMAGAYLHIGGTLSAGALYPRLQVANADQPPTQTSDAYYLNGELADNRDIAPWVMLTRESITADITVDADAYVSSTLTGRGYGDRALVVFSTELASAGVSVTPAHAEASATAIAPAVSAPLTFTAAHAEGSALAIAPAVSAPETIAPAWAEGSAVAVEPTPVNGSVTVVPAAAVARALAPDPTAVAESLTLTPAWAEASALAVAPTVTTPLTLTPAMAESSALAVEPTVVLGSLDIAPAAAVARAAAVAPTVVEGSVTLTPEYAHTHTEAVSPTVLAPFSLVPAWAEATAAAVEPTVVAGSLSLTPAAAVARALGVSPTVTTETPPFTPAFAAARAQAVAPTVDAPFTFTAAWAEASALATDPTPVAGSLTLAPEYAHSHTDAFIVVVESGVAVTPAWAEASALAVEPTVILGDLSLTPAPAVARALAVEPTVVLGSLSVTPEYAHTHAEATDPAVVLGSLSLTPAWAEASVTAIEPVVVLGSLALTPTHAESSATAPDPTVTTGADVTVTPAFAAARALAVLLVVEQEGYRWRNDDGDEATATWQQAQDTPGTVIPGATVRLRMLVNGVSGDPVAEGYRLEYRKQGEQNWQVVS